MTYNEFTTRTNVEVSNKEFDAINEVYMNCDLDKDEFCKMWCKMNASRVAKAIAEKKQAEEDADNKWNVQNIYWFLFHDLRYEEKVSKIGNKVLTKREQKFVKSIGINTELLAYEMMNEMAEYAGIN